MKTKHSKFIYFTVTIIMLVLNVSGYLNPKTFDTAAYTFSSEINAYTTAVKDGDVNNVYSKETTLLNENTKQLVYLGGMPLGLELHTKGLIIIGKTDVITKEGLVNPTKDSNIEIGDVLLKVDNKDINTAEELTAVINAENVKGKNVSCVVKRRNKTINTSLSSALDMTSGTFKTGLWVRQDAFGIGTLAFIKQDLRFAALGHPVIDGDTKETLMIRSGNILDCSIAGCIRGERGKPGELKGMIIKDKGKCGSIDKNNMFGIYGYMDSVMKNNLHPNLIETMPRSQVRPGKAHIYTTISGGQPEMFEIEIVKTAYQAKPADRSMVIRVTDRKLLSKTGGIVQGMSGSPIVQNGKLCGAVTHVFVNDPTRGYGLYSDWMLTQ